MNQTLGVEQTDWHTHSLALIRGTALPLTELVYFKNVGYRSSICKTTREGQTNKQTNTVFWAGVEVYVRVDMGGGTNKRTNTFFLEGGRTNEQTLVFGPD